MAGMGEYCVAREQIIILSGIVAAMHQAKLASAIPALEATLSINMIEAGFLLALVQLAGMTIGLFVGLAADRIGLRRSLLSGLIIIMLASIAGGGVKSVYSLLFLRALEGLGFLLIVLPAPGLIRRLVAPQNLSRQLGFWGGYMGLGTGFALLLGPWFIEQLGWEGLWWFLSFLTFGIAVIVMQKIPADPCRQCDLAGSKQFGWRQSLTATLKAPGPWLVAIIFSLYSSQWLSVVGFLPTLYTQAGFSGGLIGVLTSAVALVNVAGNCCGGLLMHRGYAPRSLLVGGFFFMALSSMLAFSSVTESLPLLRFFAVLSFSAVGGVIPGALFSMAIRVAPGEHTVSATIGLMQQWSSLGQFAGPPLVGGVAMAVGGWQWTWAVTTSASLLGVFLILMLFRRLN